MKISMGNEMSVSKTFLMINNTQSTFFISILFVIQQKNLASSNTGLEMTTFS